MKSSGLKEACYAQGGAVLGKTSQWFKTDDEFRDPEEGKMESMNVVGNLADADQKYGKSGDGKGNGMYPAPAAKGKCLSPVKPR